MYVSRQITTLGTFVYIWGQNGEGREGAEMDVPRGIPGNIFHDIDHEHHPFTRPQQDDLK